MGSAPPNAYLPGKKLTVGSHAVTITKYLSSGGFAHVYTCEISPPYRGSLTACLKRVVVPTKLQLNLLRQEVDAMKRLKGNDNIVSYIDSHALRLGAGGASAPQQYEVFLLMEYCSRNGLIDFMNTRLSYKLQEPEILTIMRDVTVGVAMCHHLRPPLLHRDIKIENVLIDAHGTYKLCDFGLAVPYAPVPQNAQELQLLHEDIVHYTTPQYRAPEMIELSRGFPIDDKLDVWALGCFLYKLCYYTTPFELAHHALMADLERLILQSAHTLKFPPDQPGLQFLPRLKNVIKCCLREDPRRRPTAVQLLQEVCLMKNEALPNVIPYTMKDKFSKLEPSLVEPPPETPAKPREKAKDPFASIDKSKLLKEVKDDGHRLKTSYSVNAINSGFGAHNPAKATAARTRPLSYVDSSATLLKSYVQSQLATSEHHHVDEPSTLDFLRSKEEENRGLGLRQNTGGSLRQSWKDGIRRISTGNSTHSSQNVHSGHNGSGEKRSTFGTVKKVLTGGSFRRLSSSPDEEPDTQSLLIQKRMAQLLNGSESKVKKTAEGYGRFTDKLEYVDLDDIDAINRMEVVPKRNRSLRKGPPQVPLSLRAEKEKGDKWEKRENWEEKASYGGLKLKAGQEKPASKFSERSQIKSRDTTPLAKPVQIPSSREALSPMAKMDHKKPPPKPKKPTYLKERRRPSASSDEAVDIDDLEKQFAKRFPSYV